MRTDSIQILLPCDSAIFQASSAAKWAQLVDEGHAISTPAISLSSQHASIPTLRGTPDILAMYGILCTIRLRISDDCHRLLSDNQNEGAERSFVPWQKFTTDPRAKITQALVVQFIRPYGTILGEKNPNCIALWHNTCIMLTADVHLFELAAGCAGAAPAQQALENIALWSQTIAARRAVVHAAQTFKMLSNRRASDVDPFHASYCLFIAALILGLYVFMVPVEPDNEGADTTFELMDDVDWARVGDTALSNNGDFVDDPTVSFIKKGGRISLAGVVHEAGYQSARRIMLDYAHLLEDTGGWKLGRYSQVLRIMSDALVDVDSL
jgi:hypothetical protein